VRLALRNAHLGVERLLLAQLESPQRVHVALGLAHLERLRVQVHEARRRLREGREGRLAPTAPSAAAGRRPTIFGRSTKIGSSSIFLRCVALNVIFLRVYIELWLEKKRTKIGVCIYEAIKK
jgi:hypothetical protein